MSNVAFALHARVVKLAGDEEAQGCIFDKRGFFSNEVAILPRSASGDADPDGCATQTVRGSSSVIDIACSSSETSSCLRGDCCGKLLNVRKRGLEAWCKNRLAVGGAGQYNTKRSPRQ